MEEHSLYVLSCEVHVRESMCHSVNLHLALKAWLSGGQCPIKDSVFTCVSA